MDKIEYSVPILDGDKKVTVVFSDKETKERFIKNEIKFCKAELIKKFAAITKRERSVSDKELNEVRAKHATNKGYRPVGYEGNRWFYNPVKPDNNILA